MSNSSEMLQIFSMAPSREMAMACIVACAECEKACRACSEACRAEHDMAMDLRIRFNEDCADMCEATSHMLSRPILEDADMALLSNQLQACADACQLCADECDQHAEHRPCRACVQACRQCEEACSRLAAAITETSMSAGTAMVNPVKTHMPVFD